MGDHGWGLVVGYNSWLDDYMWLYTVELVVNWVLCEFLFVGICRAWCVWFTWNRTHFPSPLLSCAYGRVCVALCVYDMYVWMIEVGVTATLGMSELCVWVLWFCWNITTNQLFFFRMGSILNIYIKFMSLFWVGRVSFRLPDFEDLPAGLWTLVSWWGS